MSFGVGVLAMQYYPQTVGSFGLPTLLIGIALLFFAAKGFARKNVTKD